MAEARDSSQTGGSPLAVMSNRLPFTLQRTARGIERRHSPGGLVSALEPVPHGQILGAAELVARLAEQQHGVVRCPEADPQRVLCALAQAG